MPKMSEKQIFEEMLRLLHKAHTDPALIYAFKKTRRLVSAVTRKVLSKKDLKEWDDAIDEYYERVKRFN
jgi:hypothetical protein